MTDLQTLPATITKESPEPKTLAKIQAQSVREFWPGTFGGVIGGDAIGMMFAQPDLLPAWGTFACDRALRLLDSMQFNALWSGARNVYIDKILSTPSEISGGRNLTYNWQDIFYFNSEFGEGYDFMMTKVLIDFLTLNRGAFIEKVSYGNSDTPIKDGAAIVGLNHLDAMRIVMTGNREYPYIYYSEYTGEYHRMHYTRILRLVHKPSPMTTMFGMGKSALYDAMSVANAQILLGKAQNEMLSDSPPAGLIVFNNIKGEDVTNAMMQFAAENKRDGMTTYRAPLHLESKNPAEPATVEFIPLRTMPVDFDLEKYEKVHVNLLALTMGLDPQDIWPLSSHSMGSGAQSTILEQKTRGKGPGYVLALLERMWNSVLPRSLEFKYKAANSQQGKEEADIAAAWSTALQPITFMTDDEKRQIMANQVEAFADALLDEDGTVIRLPDVDPKDTSQQEDVVADEAGGAGDKLPTEQATTASDTEQMGQNAPAAKEPPPTTKGLLVRKDIDATTSEFIDDMTTAMQDGVDKTVSKASTAARIRGAISRYGKTAYQDGLEDGGVDAELDDDDTRIIADIAVHDTQFVSDLANEIYSDDGMRMTPETRAPLWTTTLMEFYYAGLQSADANGMYTFTGDDGKESCDTCKSLKGTSHRMKWWVDNELRPGVDSENFDCKAFNCQHTLEKRSKNG